jgi:hypothetical protein
MGKLLELMRLQAIVRQHKIKFNKNANLIKWIHGVSFNAFKVMPMLFSDLISLQV